MEKRKSKGRTKPRYGWRYPENYFQTVQYSLSEELKQNLRRPSLKKPAPEGIEKAFPAIEKAIGDYLSWPKDSGPTMAELRAAVQELDKTLNDLSLLLGPSGLDSKTRQFVSGTDEAELLELERALDSLRTAVSHGRKLLEAGSKSRYLTERDSHSMNRFLLARDIKDALVAAGIPWSTSREGFCEVILRHVMKEVGHPLSDAQHLARAVRDNSPGFMRAKASNKIG